MRPETPAPVEAKMEEKFEAEAEIKAEVKSQSEVAMVPMGKMAKEQGNEADEFEAQFKRMKREEEWKTCLIVCLVITCALFMVAFIVAMLDSAKYRGFSNRDCVGSSGVYVAPKYSPGTKMQNQCRYCYLRLHSYRLTIPVLNDLSGSFW